MPNVFLGPDKLWYFWEKNGRYTRGPFETAERAVAAYEEYCFGLETGDDDGE
jgi:hypothetical protein